MANLFWIVVQFLVVLFAISVHESAHAWTADRMGDPTARLQGRVTLNPLAHIDLLGTIIFPLLLAWMGAPVFGWAKPVMVNPYNFRDRRRGGILVAAAGPLANIAVAAVTILIFLPLKSTMLVSRLPILFTVFIYLIIINLYLAVFNLIPIPPLDGSGVLEGVLRGSALDMYQKIKPYGFLILLLIIYTRALNFIAAPIELLVRALLGL